ncbi:D-alanine--D-alanine ligase [Limibacter armeniacum]|uniref:D-alanine--D-alanine ligase family protein n=1 Tax=Limibacter armeniacum TaxID=466084 RepID=UPI002FE56161
MKIGIFFGGQSREREISFAGGRTVYDNLNKGLFEPVPIFVDSLGNFIHLNWEYIYKGTIRDFYPPMSKIPATLHEFQLYIESLGALSTEEQEAIIAEVGTKVQPESFASLMDFAFLTLHGPYGEDGSLQGILEWYGIPYAGAGILSASIGIDKSVQKQLFENFGIPTPKSTVLTADAWQQSDKAALFADTKKSLDFPFVVKAPHQGSSLGVAVVQEDTVEAFVDAVENAFFIEKVTRTQWEQYTAEDKKKFVTGLIDIRQGIGLPLILNNIPSPVHNPKQLVSKLDEFFAVSDAEVAELKAVDSEEMVLIEQFVEGREFSCIVVQDEQGKPLSLPPTEIVKGKDLFDYRSKYLPGMSRKLTPINIETEKIRQIQKACADLYAKLQFNVYARIDGFIIASGEIFLNDPNTTSGMLPSSFFFHQAAEIGLTPSQFLTYIIRTSLAERAKSGKKSYAIKELMHQLDEQIASQQQQESDKTRVAVIMGGYSSERHISVESGRNIFEKLSSSEKYEPIPVFLTGSGEHHELYQLPINIMLKDNADDIKTKIREALEQPKHEVIAETIENASAITNKYAGEVSFVPVPLTYEQLAEKVDAVFIALHGRPGEDGAVQQNLDKLRLPYNGSGVQSSQTTIDKYMTKEILKEHGFIVADHRMVYKNEWQEKGDALLDEIESKFEYPLIAKPSDDGCSSAVMKIKSRQQLADFTRTMFRETELPTEEQRNALGLQKNEEFPQKTYYLIEELIDRKGADHFLEITGGMLTKWENGEKTYEVFEPSEALATNEILSLEEKFLAGEGQNITPSRFAPNKERQAEISAIVREDLKRAAKALNVEGYCRIDAFVRIWEDKVETIVIEVNSLPGMTPATCIFHQAAINHYKPYDFIDKILDYGMRKAQYLSV